MRDNSVLGRFTEAARSMDEGHAELKADYAHITRINNIYRLADYRDEKPVEYEINPWPLAGALSAVLWLAIWVVGWVMLP